MSFEFHRAEITLAEDQKNTIAEALLMYGKNRNQFLAAWRDATIESGWAKLEEITRDQLDNLFSSNILPYQPTDGKFSGFLESLKSSCQQMKSPKFKYLLEKDIILNSEVSAVIENASELWAKDREKFYKTWESHVDSESKLFLIFESGLDSLFEDYYLPYHPNSNLFLRMIGKFQLCIQEI